MKSSDGGLAAIVYAPCVVDTFVEGKPVRVEVSPDSTYPFGDERESRILIKVQSQVKNRFPLYLRIPAWGEGTVCGIWENATTFERASDLKPGAFLTLDREWGGNQPIEITLTIPMPLRLREGYHGAVSIQRGPVVYALQIDPDWKMVKDRPGLPFDDWEVHPKTPWNYALEIDRMHPEQSVVIEPRKPVGPLFSSEGAPLAAKVKGRPSRLGPGTRSGGSATGRSLVQQGAAGGIDPDSLRLHRPENHRVSHIGCSMKCASFIRSSIVWKLTLFVGVFVALNGAVLIGVAYVTTSAILRDQIHKRLSTIAAGRQEMLVLALRQQMDQTAQLASLPGIQTLLTKRAQGTTASETIRAEIATILFHGKASATGVLAVWIEDESGDLIASSGPENLVAEYGRARGSGEKPGGKLIVPPRRSGGPVRLLSLAMIPGAAGQSARNHRAAGRFRADGLIAGGPARPGRVRRSPGGRESRRGDPFAVPAPAQIPGRRADRERAAGLERGERGRIRLRMDDRLSRRKRPGVVPACGGGVPRLGIDRQDGHRRGVRPGHAAAWCVAGLGGSGPAIGVGSVQRDRTAVCASDS